MESLVELPKRYFVAVEVLAKWDLRNGSYNRVSCGVIVGHLPFLIINMVAVK